jgi:hypothetical protein
MNVNQQAYGNVSKLDIGIDWMLCCPLLFVFPKSTHRGPRYLGQAGFLHMLWPRGKA